MYLADILIDREAPHNVNHLYQNKYKFILQKLPHVQFFCTSANIPGINVQNQEIYNSINYLNVAGTKVRFEDLSVIFKVDEDLKNYIELRNWIIGIGSPTTADEFKKLIQENSLHEKPSYDIYSDGSIATLNNVHQFNLKVTYKDMFPIGLSGINFDEQNVPVVAQANFKYLNFDITNDAW